MCSRCLFGGRINHRSVIFVLLEHEIVNVVVELERRWLEELPVFDVPLDHLCHRNNVLSLLDPLDVLQYLVCC